MEKQYASKNFYPNHLLKTQILFNKCNPYFDSIKRKDIFYKSNAGSGISNGALRLTTVFLQLLDKQFPIYSINQKMKCRYPVDFAGALSIHINHLNRSLKDITGKTTSHHIGERIMKEAQSLLIYTEWNICEIGYCFGFEEGPHFINFFKKNIKISPSAYRKMNRLKNIYINKQSFL